MIEADYNQRLNSHLAPHLKECRKLSVSYSNGIPDNYYLGTARHLWMEAKLIAELPKRDTTQVVPDCSALQLAFLKNQFDTDGCAMVAMGVKRAPGIRGAATILFYTADEWEFGISAGEARQRLLAYAPAAQIILAHCNTP